MGYSQRRYKIYQNKIKNNYVKYDKMSKGQYEYYKHLKEDTLIPQMTRLFRIIIEILAFILLWVWIGLVNGQDMTNFIQEIIQPFRILFLIIILFFFIALWIDNKDTEYADYWLEKEGLTKKEDKKP